jgi:diacylglycerol O-acyltransferase / wax synthase
MRKLSLLDFGFFVCETEASPKHVGGLMLCKRPAKANASFAKNLYKEYLSHTEVKAPFNRIITFTKTAMPRWQDAEDMDLKDHIFYHKLDAGEDERKSLYDFVAKLHEPMLDRSRPLWEMHIIDGLSDGRFAVYNKIHHSVTDGVTMVQWLADSLSKTSEDGVLTPVWTLNHGGYTVRRNKVVQDHLQAAWEEIGNATSRVVGISRLAAMLMLESVRLTKNAIAIPFISSTKTMLTGQVTSGRQFATAAVSMERVNAIRKLTRSTLNHVALTCMDGALRRYLSEEGVELFRPIVIQMPVNLREEGDTQAGNKLGIIQVEMSPATDDPYVRLRNIGFSLRNVRNMINSVAPEAIESYTIVTGLIAQIAETLKLSDKMPPMGNTLISNIAGPAKQMYLKGAVMEEMHPISTLPPSNLLNVTLFSYAGSLYFGMVATDALPNLDRLGRLVEEAFVELEDSILMPLAA